MKTLCYYISDYGFGHASRSVAIIRELLRHSDKIRVFVCHSYAIDFMKESLVNEKRVKYRVVSTDIGYKLKHNSLEPDIKGMDIAFDSYMESLDDLVKDEIEFCTNNNVNLILSDIVPFPFKVAKELGVPSIGISNFTWYTAYKQLIEKGKLDRFKGYYSLMDYHFSLATSNEFEWGIIEEKGFGFVSRECDDNEVLELKEKLDPTGKKTIVYFGLGMKIFMDQLDVLGLWNSPNCVFIVSSNVEVQRKNIYKIPEDYTESQHFIAASDIVITKAGWSTIAEAINSNKPLIVLNRSNMEEDQNTIQYLISHQRADIMDWNQIKDLKINQEMMVQLSKQKNIVTVK
ncbi:uncharacterized protein (TIGR00661 family) [Salirhabdus euzebyi]|uniref:Uncharacterized protein (TIGR00661 family) n=1 Tax=Salirhabdus euzebyi TaxID=394506 RepID=A0A841Q7Y1_9BACI|nr:glycosyltransferase [Salirhabdus euzebyi]MBB6454551.1 uncharacterized protein (TIGR00661 family) [Salirhabdus euzebyi]